MRCSLLLLFIATTSLQLGIAHNVKGVHERGYWLRADAFKKHWFDQPLSEELTSFLKNEGASTVVDFGCGMGDYVKTMIASDIDAIGYDGNPHTPKLTDGLCHVLDLSQPQNLGKTFDWVVSLEVGEHLPAEYETTLIENLHRHNRKGIVLSWARLGQGGYGHFNCRSNAYIIEAITKLGYTYDSEAAEMLRASAKAKHFKHTIMVFRRISPS